MNNYEDAIKRIAMNIKAIRQSKGLSIQEIAYRCDMERSNLSRLEAGKTNMTIKMETTRFLTLSLYWKKVTSG